MYIKLPVLYMDQEDQAHIEDGNEYQTITLSINVAFIVSHWVGVDNLTHFTLADGTEHISTILHKAFVALLDDCFVSVELRPTDN